MTEPDHADYDAALTQECEYIATLLSNLATTLRALPVDQLTEVLPAVAMPLEDIVTRVRQLGVSVWAPYPETAEGASRPLGGASVPRERE